MTLDGQPDKDRQKLMRNLRVSMDQSLDFNNFLK